MSSALVNIMDESELSVFFLLIHQFFFFADSSNIFRNSINIQLVDPNKQKLAFKMDITTCHNQSLMVETTMMQCWERNWCSKPNPFVNCTVCAAIKNKCYSIQVTDTMVTVEFKYQSFPTVALNIPVTEFKSKSCNSSTIVRNSKYISYLANEVTTLRNRLATLEIRGKPFYLSKFKSLPLKNSVFHAIPASWTPADNAFAEQILESKLDDDDIKDSTYAGLGLSVRPHFGGVQYHKNSKVVVIPTQTASNRFEFIFNSEIVTGDIRLRWKSIKSFDVWNSRLVEIGVFGNSFPSNFFYRSSPVQILHLFNFNPCANRDFGWRSTPMISGECILGEYSFVILPTGELRCICTGYYNPTTMKRCSELIPLKDQIPKMSSQVVTRKMDMIKGGTMNISLVFKPM